jgi:hypothetical protein
MGNEQETLNDYVMGDYSSKSEARAKAMVDSAMEVLGDIGSHLKDRLSLGTIASEAFEYLTDNVIPQGRDEAANLLFNGAAYWPGNQVDMSPDLGGGVHGPAMTQETGSVYGAEAPQSEAVNAYLMGDYSPSQPSQESMYFSPGQGSVYDQGSVYGDSSPSSSLESYSMGSYAPSAEYTAMLDEMAARAPQQQSQELEY